MNKNVRFIRSTIHIHQKEFIVSILITNNRAGNAAPARRVQPGSTARTYNFNQLPLSTQAKATQTEYTVPPFLNCLGNVVWRLMPDTPIGRALNAAKNYFASMGKPNARQETFALLASVLQQKRSWLFTNYDYQLNIEQIERYRDLIRRRVANEPLEYLINVQVQFRGY